MPGWWSVLSSMAAATTAALKGKLKRLRELISLRRLASAVLLGPPPARARGPQQAPSGKQRAPEDSMSLVCKGPMSKCAGPFDAIRVGNRTR